MNPSNQIFWLRFQERIAYDVRVRMESFAHQGYDYRVDLQMNAQFFTNGIIGTLLWWLRNQRPLPEQTFLSQIIPLMDPRNALNR